MTIHKLIKNAVRMAMIATCYCFLLSTSCESDYAHYSEWRVVNSTDTPLTIVSFIHGSSHIKRYIDANSSIYLFEKYNWENYQHIPFNSFYVPQNYNDINDMHDSIYVVDTEGNILKKWYPKDKDKPGRQFFNETYWKKQNIYNDSDDYRWTFNIIQEDIE